MLMCPLLSSAQLVSLTCVNPGDNFTIDIELDERNNAVSVNGVRQYANYTNNSITFNLKIDGETWFHNINRNNGVMMVQRQSNKFILPSYNCKVSTRKF
jgi:hypothetical protein